MGVIRHQMLLKQQNISKPHLSRSLHYFERFLARFLISFVFNKVAIAFGFLTKRPQSFLIEFQALT